MTARKRFEGWASRFSWPRDEHGLQKTGDAWLAWQELDARVQVLEGALQAAIYEITHLSSAAWDGHYTPRIKESVVNGWREVLASDSSSHVKEGK
jgi:hypothetical protein